MSKSFFLNRLLLGDFFNLIWTFVVQCLVGTLGVVKGHVRFYTAFELIHRVIIRPIQFLSLQAGEKGFRDGIVCGLAGIGEGLRYPVRGEQFLECLGGILRSSVTVEDQTRLRTALFVCLPKGRRDQPGPA